MGGAHLAVIESRYRTAGDTFDEAEVCLASGIPYMTHGQDALEAVVGPLVKPGGSPCHRCAESRRLAHEDHLHEHLAYRDHRARHAPRPDAFLAAHSAFLAGLVATEALHFLAGGTPAVLDGALVVDLLTMAVRREEVLPVPGCTGCGGHTGAISLDRQ